MCLYSYCYLVQKYEQLYVENETGIVCWNELMSYLINRLKRRINSISNTLCARDTKSNASIRILFVVVFAWDFWKKFVYVFQGKIFVLEMANNLTGSSK